MAKCRLISRNSPMPRTLQSTPYWISMPSLAYLRWLLAENFLNLKRENYSENSPFYRLKILKVCVNALIKGYVIISIYFPHEFSLRYKFFCCLKIKFIVLIFIKVISIIFRSIAFTFCFTYSCQALC